MVDGTAATMEIGIATIGIIGIVTGAAIGTRGATAIATIAGAGGVGDTVTVTSVHQHYS